MIEIDNDLKDIVICALRYALGRRTYITLSIYEYIVGHKELIDNRVKAIMLRDISQYEEDRNNMSSIAPLDDECDYINWCALKKWLENLEV